MKWEELIEKLYSIYKIDRNEIKKDISLYFNIDLVSITKYIFSNDEVNQLINIYKQIQLGVPKNYAFKFKYFLGEKYIITKDVLIPRNETEQMVETSINEIKKYFSKQNLIISEIGTGSGVIAISLSKKLSNLSKIFAGDISSKALKIAKQNAKNINVKNIRFVKSNIFKNMPNQIDVIISNPPYIKKGDKALSSIVQKSEPKKSLFSKKNGLAIIEKILKQGNKKTSSKWMIILEFGWSQKDSIEYLINKYLSNINYNIYKDYSKNWRFVIIRGDRNESSRN